MGGQTHPFTDVMVFEELPVVEETVVVVKKAIKKSEARTQLTAAKKPKKKKKKKKKAKKKKKKKKKKKAKKVRFVGGKRRKGQHKSKASIAAGKKNAAKQKKSGKGIFKPATLSAALSKVTGINGKTTRGQVFKALWAYIKKKGINKGRTVGKIDGLWNGGSMFKMTAAVSKHIK